MSRRSRETMLPRPWDLAFQASGEVVEDVEALARGVLGAEGWPKYLEEADNVELLAFLLGEAVVLELSYVPRDGIEARPWLFQRLRWRARDWREVAERHRVLADLPPILDEDPDAGGAVAAGGRDTRAGNGRGLTDGAPWADPGDRRDSGLDALSRLLEDGHSGLLREIEALGLSAPPGARGATPRARRELARLDRQRRERVARRLEQVAA